MPHFCKFSKRLLCWLILSAHRARLAANNAVDRRRTVSAQMALEPEFLAAASRRKGVGKGRGGGRGGGASASSPPGRDRGERKVRASIEGTYRGESIVGSVVGKQGSVISELQRVSGALIQINKEQSTIMIDGTPDEARRKRWKSLICFTLPPAVAWHCRTFARSTGRRAHLIC